MLTRIFTLTGILFVAALLTIAATPSYLPVDGKIVQTMQWTTNGTERWLAVVSRTVITLSPTRYQYELSFLRPRRYLPSNFPNRTGYSIPYRAPSAGPTSYLTKFNTKGLKGSDLPANAQNVKLIGVFDGYLLVLKHEETGDCGASELTFFAVTNEGPELAYRIVNRCSLNATIIGKGRASYVDVHGPYYKPSNDPINQTPLCCPTIKNAQTLIRLVQNGEFSFSTGYFRFEKQ